MSKPAKVGKKRTLEIEEEKVDAIKDEPAKKRQRRRPHNNAPKSNEASNESNDKSNDKEKEKEKKNENKDWDQELPILTNELNEFNAECMKSRVGGAAKTPLLFGFDESRIRDAKGGTHGAANSKNCNHFDNINGVAYWMSRDQRVQDNWALVYAQKIALEKKVPLYVVFCLLPKFLDATLRQFDFMLKGLMEVENECRALNIPFYLLLGQCTKVLPKWVEENNINLVVTDFAALKYAWHWYETIGNELKSKNIHFSQVDAHNIVPLWVASNKQEYGARTIRSKINSKLDRYFTEFPPIIKHEFEEKEKSNKESSKDKSNDNESSSDWMSKHKKVDWDNAWKLLEIDESIKPVKWAKPGTQGGLNVLMIFIHKKLKNYASLRNDPNEEAVSNLSPWLHFGQISAQRVALTVSNVHSKDKQYNKESIDSFLEELIVRRELSDNYCFYNKNYDNINGAYSWAYDTLNDHRKDKREYIYSLKEFENYQTHDDLWNAAQKQMVIEAKMHGFLRMYWAKKILEWCDTPENAIKIAIYLNDKYNIDGRDSNGYVGVMWSICGIHDQGWRERSIFGKIRFMNYQGCKRKFNVAQFVKKWKV